MKRNNGIVENWNIPNPDKPEKTNNKSQITNNIQCPKFKIPNMLKISKNEHIKTVLVIEY